MEVNTNEGHMVSFLPITLCVFLNDVYCSFSVLFFKVPSQKTNKELIWLGPAWDITTRNQVHVTAFALLALVFTKGHLSTCSLELSVFNSTSQQS